MCLGDQRPGLGKCKFVKLGSGGLRTLEQLLNEEVRPWQKVFPQNLKGFGENPFQQESAIAFYKLTLLIFQILKVTVRIGLSERTSSTTAFWSEFNPLSGWQIKLFSVFPTCKIVVLFHRQAKWPNNVMSTSKVRTFLQSCQWRTFTKVT